jgi:sigma-54 specific flagellar transcriptional regulator A
VPAHSATLTQTPSEAPCLHASEVLQLLEPAEVAANVVLAGPLQAGESLTALPPQGLDLRAHLAAIERSLIEQALARSSGTVAHAARLLNLRRTTLVERLRRLGMLPSQSATEL